MNWLNCPVWDEKQLIVYWYLVFKKMLFLWMFMFIEFHLFLYFLFDGVNDIFAEFEMP